MTELNSWLRQATRHLEKGAVAQVRLEIQEHFASSRDAAIARGAAKDEADQAALSALGGAKVANRQYRRVLLTAAEARMLREGNWEAGVVCSRSWVRWVGLAMLLAAMASIAALLITGRVGVARDVLLCATGMSKLVLALFLPIYSPSRGRIFRCLRLVAMTGAIVLLFGSDAMKWSWLLISCSAPIAWTEWMRASIRRKLPVEAWPRHLYL